MEKYEENFLSNEIGFDDLSELSMEELKNDLEIAVLGSRKKIIKAIANIRLFDELEENIILTYPYSIAYPFKLMMEEEHASQKISIMKDVLLNVLKHLGLLTATEYFLSDKKSKLINKLFTDKLYQPHFGNWNHFIRETLGFLEKHEHSFFIQEMPSFYKKVESGKKVPEYKLENRFTNEAGDEEILVKKFTAIGGLIYFRNRILAHGMTLNREKSQIVFDQYYPLLKDLLSEMTFIQKYPLYKINQEERIKLMGVQFQKEKWDKHKEPNNYSLWIENPQGNQLPLIPFYINPDRYLSNINKQVQLFVYEQYTGKRIVYYSPKQESGETSGEPVNVLNGMLKDKSRLEAIKIENYTEEMLQSTLFNESSVTIEELIREQKVIPAVYQSRQDNETDIHSFINNPKSLYFIAAEAGSGKTNLLAEMHRQLVSQKKTVLFLRAIRQAAKQLEVTLKKVLNLSEESELSSAQVFATRSHHNSIIIMIDGLNEHKEPEVFLESCINLLRKMPKGSIKIIISWRVNSPGDYPVIHQEMSGFLYDAGGENSINHQENQLITHAAILKPLNKSEISLAWKKYRKDSQKRFSTRFTFEELELKDREFSQNLSNPLLLRMFMELNKGKVLPQKSKTLRIWPEWYKNLGNQIPDVKSVLSAIIREIYQKEENILDVDSLFDHTDLKSIVRPLNIDSPYRRLLAKGILSQYFRQGFLSLTFTVEGIFHYLLSQFLLNEVKYQSGQDLIEIINNKHRLKGIKEAVGYCLLEDVLKGEIKQLAEFIHADAKYLEVVSVPLSVAIQHLPHQDILNHLLGKKDSHSLDAIFLADYILERNLLNNIRYNFFKTLLKTIHFSDFSKEIIEKLYLRYHLICHETGKYEESLQYAIQLYEQRKLISEKEDSAMAVAYNRMAVAYRKLMRNTDSTNIKEYGDKALQYEKKALQIREQQLLPGDLDIARSFDNMEKIYEYKEEWAKAVEYGIKLIELYKTNFGHYYPLLAGAYNNTAIVLRENLEKEKSIDFSHKALEIVRKSFGEVHVEMAYANWTLSNTYVKFQEKEKAFVCINKTVAILEKLLANDHPNMLMARDAQKKLK
jgi:hypothetical protein